METARSLPDPSLFTGGKHPAGLAGDWQGVS